MSTPGEGQPEVMDSAGVLAGPGWPTLGKQCLDGIEIAMSLAQYGGAQGERSTFPAS